MVKISQLNKFLYPFGKKTFIKDTMYPAYYRTWLLFQLGVPMTTELIDRELKITTSRLEREAQ